jgi:hypothetical protein
MGRQPVSRRMARIAVVIAGATFVQIGSCTVDDTAFSDLVTAVVQAIVSALSSSLTT